MRTYYILIRTHRDPNGRTVYVKDGGTIYVNDGDYFEAQGGLVNDWGKDWIPVRAGSIEHARQIGQKMELQHESV